MAATVAYWAMPTAIHERTVGLINFSRRRWNIWIRDLCPGMCSRRCVFIRWECSNVVLNCHNPTLYLPAFRLLIILLNIIGTMTFSFCGMLSLTALQVYQNCAWWARSSNVTPQLSATTGAWCYKLWDPYCQLRICKVTARYKCLLILRSSPISFWKSIRASLSLPWHNDVHHWLYQTRRQ